MNFKVLGKTQIKISQISLGTGSLVGSEGGYGLGNKALEDFESVFIRAMELGINCVDTAPIYGFGFIESELGKLSTFRSKYLLATKGGVCFSQKRNVRVDNSPSMLGSMIHESLKRLNTDYIDFYFLHWPDPNTPFEISFRYLLDLKKKGIIRNIGLSNFDLSILHEDFLKLVDVVQLKCNPLDTNQKAKNFIEKYDLGSFCFGTLGKGLLMEPKKEFEVFDYRHKMSKEENNIYFKPQKKYYSVQELLDFALKECGWNHTAIVGVKNVSQLTEACKFKKK